jgi:hypothetical protein
LRTVRRGLASASACLAAWLALAPAIPAQSPGAVRAAEELLAVMEMDRLLRESAMAGLDAQIAMNPALAPYRDVMERFVTKVLTWDAMRPNVVQLYAETFTEAELRAITAFYRTPAGQKSVRAMPELMRRGAEIGDAILQAHAAELEAMLLQRMEELEARPREP